MLASPEPPSFEARRKGGAHLPATTAKPLRGDDVRMCCETILVRPPPPRPSPQLQRGEAGERQHHRNDPEPDHDLRFGPALLLEMMMQRRHPEHALAGELERHHLHD